MNNLQAHIFENLLPEKECTIYLAISGGVDSIVLLDILLQAKRKVHLLHVNYHLRGDDSNADEALVRRLAENFNTPISVLDFNMKKHLEKGGNLQNEARKVRYDFFNQYLSENDILMTAHHFDDQMETFFMNMSRKSGVAGMSCMLAKNEHLYRPLLNFRKADLYAYAEENQLEFREDISNQENKYLRNQWRNIWIPLMEKEFPNLGEQVHVLIQTFQNERRLLEEKHAVLMNEIEISKKWNFSSFDTVDDEGKYLIGKKLGLKVSEINRLMELRQSEKSRFIFVGDDEIKIWNNGSAFIWQEKDTWEIPVLNIKQSYTLPSKFDKNSCYVDAEKLEGNLTIRFWKEGDRIAPIGMKGTQLVSDIIKDAKVELSEKLKVLVVEDDEKIIWVVGLKVGREAVADENSERILKVWVD